MSKQPNLKCGNVSSVDFIEVGNLTSPRTVLMMHGFGANAEDLIELHRYLDTDQKFRWIFLNGTLSLPREYGPNSRAWFPIRISELEAAARIEGESSFTRVPPEGIDPSSQLVINVISELNIIPSELVLGGFSQGAMMAIQVCCKLEVSPKGLMIFSGSLVNSLIWRSVLPKHSSTKYFQSHGTNDTILGIANATRLNEVLAESGLSGSFERFIGGHEIPLSVVRSAANFLKEL